MIEPDKKYNREEKESALSPRTKKKITKVIKGVNDLTTTHPELASQWDFERNGNLIPEHVSAGSNRKVNWICHNGHSWCATIYKRSRGNDCPYCSGRLPIKGKTDLATTHPELASQWDFERNGDLMPEHVSAGSNRKVNWICKNGHSWCATIYNRSRGNDCPYCRKRLPVKGKTDLATTHPELASQWDFERNGNLIPEHVSAGSNRKVNWICHNGHSWCATIYKRSRGNDCPYCSGRLPIKGKTDLATTHPKLATEWDYNKNQSLTPEMVTHGSHRKVHWKCSKGHEWMAKIYERTNGTDCPYCGRKLPIKGETDLATTHPKLAAEWDYEKNEGLTPEMVTYGSTRMAHWKCKKGHEWTATINQRTNQKSQCPYCSRKLPIKGETDLATTHPKLATEWNYNKNNGLTPEMVTHGSKRKVHWKCEKGHEWMAPIYQRSNTKRGCPYCSGRLPVKGETDLATTHPYLVKEWDYNKNEGITPETVSYGSACKVHWKCKKGHEWTTRLYDRVRTGSNCPYCSKRRRIYNTLQP